MRVSRFLLALTLGSGALLLAGVHNAQAARRVRIISPYFQRSNPLGRGYGPGNPYGRGNRNRNNLTRRNGYNGRGNGRNGGNNLNRLNRGGRNTTRASGPTNVELNTEVSALQQRHGALAARLPTDLQRLDQSALPLVERLPVLARHGYYSTLENYPTLAEADKGRVREVMRGLAALPPERRDAFVTSAARTFDGLTANEAQLKDATAHPLNTCLRLKQELDAFK